jgi:hypothetical protein
MSVKIVSFKSITYQAVHEGLQRLLSGLFCFIISLVPDILIRELVDEFNDIYDNVYVLVREEPDQQSRSPGTNELGVSERWYLRKRKQSLY